MVRRMNRTVFLVDGLNLYHSLEAASRDLGGASTRWLDIRALLDSYLPAIGDGAVTTQIVYFSALPTHLESRKPGIAARHRLYLECLQADGIAPILGRFKPKFMLCTHCRRLSEHHEEKETDVAISVHLLEVLHRDEADTVAIVTGDTDIAPALRAARRLFPAKRIWLVLPYKRRNNELARLADGHCYVRKERYVQHQWPPIKRLPSGRIVLRPRGW